MLQIAALLDAHVQGDEGELYDEEAIETFDDSILGEGTVTPIDALAESGPKKSWGTRIANVMRRLSRNDHWNS